MKGRPSHALPGSDDLVALLRAAVVKTMSEDTPTTGGPVAAATEPGSNDLLSAWVAHLEESAGFLSVRGLTLPKLESGIDAWDVVPDRGRRVASNAVLLSEFVERCCAALVQVLCSSDEFDGEEFLRRISKAASSGKAAGEASRKRTVEAFARMWRQGRINLLLAVFWQDRGDAAKALAQATEGIAAAKPFRNSLRTSPQNSIELKRSLEIEFELLLVRAQANGISKNLEDFRNDMKAAAVIRPDSPVWHLVYGFVLQEQPDNRDDAIAHLRLARDAAWSDARVRAQAVHLLANVERGPAGPGEVLEKLRLAQRLYAKAGYLAGEAQLMDTRANVYLWMLQDTGKARDWFTRSLALKEQVGDLRGRAISLGGLGRTELIEGNIERAAECMREDLRISRQLGDVKGINTSLHTLGLAYELAAEFCEDDRTNSYRAQAVECFMQNIEHAREPSHRDPWAHFLALCGFVQLKVDMYRWREASAYVGLMGELVEERPGQLRPHAPSVKTFWSAVVAASSTGDETQRRDGIWRAYRLLAPDAQALRQMSPEERKHADAVRRATQYEQLCALLELRKIRTRKSNEDTLDQSWILEMINRSSEPFFGWMLNRERTGMMDLKEFGGQGA